MPVFEGVLFFSDFHITTIATFDPLDLCNRNTRLRILRIEGELSGDVGRERILLHLQHASYWFHDEQRDLYTLVEEDADNFGAVEFGRGRRPQGGFTRISWLNQAQAATQEPSSASSSSRNRMRDQEPCRCQHPCEGGNCLLQLRAVSFKITLSVLPPVSLT